jgi:hypothetical protein
MEAYVAAVEDVCIAPTPPPGPGEPDTPAEALRRRIAHLGWKVSSLEAIEVPAEEADAARRYLVDLYREHHENMVRHQDALMVAAAEGREALWRAMSELKVSPIIDEAGSEWVKANGVGDCGVGVRRHR